jgi:hypothetical protein
VGSFEGVQAFVAPPASTSLLGEMLYLRQTAEFANESLREAMAAVTQQREVIRHVTTEYMRKRRELFIAKLDESGRTWCTHCQKVVETESAKLVLTEGAKEVTGGYENSCWGNEEFSELHRACPECLQYFQDKHGVRGCIDESNKLQAVFYAFLVEVTSEPGNPLEYSARKFGKWVKINQEIFLGSNPKPSLMDEMAKELGLPPALDTNHSYNTPQYGELVVCEVTIAR